MRLSLSVRATSRQRQRLQTMFQIAASPRSRLHAQMVLLSAAGYAAPEIAAITHMSSETVRRCFHRFEQQGCQGLVEGIHPGRSPEITPAIELFLREAVHSLSPHAFGFVRATWTTALLAQVVKQRFRVNVTAECIRQHLARVDVVCRRPTWTVKHIARQQPGYAQKKVRLRGF
jgi:transposase